MLIYRDDIRFTCLRCGKDLVIKSGDIKAENIGRDKEYSFWVDCVCGRRSDLLMCNFPSRWLIAIFANNGIED